MFAKKIVFGLTAFAMALTGCGGGGGGSSAPSAGNSSIVVSGSLSGTSVSGLAIGPRNSGLAITDLSLYGVAFSNPPVIATAPLNADGSFSLTLAAAAGSPVTLIFRDNNNNTVGTVKFEDSSDTDLGANPKLSDTISLKGSVSLGALTLSEKGDVVVKVVDIASNIDNTPVAVGVAFDPTGSWTAKPYTGSFPAGYKNPFAADCRMDSNNGVIAPMPCFDTDMALSLIRYTGKTFVKNDGTCDPDDVYSDVNGTGCAETDGTLGADRYAVSLWQGDNSTAGGIYTCGKKTGLTADEFRAYGRIHIPSANLPNVGGSVGQLSFGRYVYSSLPGSGWGAGDNWWHNSNAIAQWDTGDCKNVTKTTTKGILTFNSCKIIWDDSGTPTPRYEAYLAGGNNCKLEDGTSVQPSNDFWSATPGAGEGCEEGSEIFPGMKESTCTYVRKLQVSDATATTVLCDNGYGRFNDRELTTVRASDEFGGTPVIFVAQGDSCAVGATTGDEKLARLRCLAQYYWQNGNDEESCLPPLETNWAAETAEDFVLKIRGQSPQVAIATNIADYSADGKTFFLNSHNESVADLPNGTVCRINVNLQLKGTQVSETKILMDISQSGTLINRDPACVAAMNAPYSESNRNLRNDTENQNWLMYLTK